MIVYITKYTKIIKKILHVGIIYIFHQFNYYSKFSRCLEQIPDASNFKSRRNKCLTRYFVIKNTVMVYSYFLVSKYHIISYNILYMKRPRYTTLMHNQQCYLSVYLQNLFFIKQSSYALFCSKQSRHKMCIKYTIFLVQIIWPSEMLCTCSAILILQQVHVVNCSYTKYKYYMEKKLKP